MPTVRSRTEGAQEQADLRLLSSPYAATTVGGFVCTGTLISRQPVRRRTFAASFLSGSEIAPGHLDVEVSLKSGSRQELEQQRPVRRGG